MNLSLKCQLCDAFNYSFLRVAKFMFAWMDANTLCLYFIWFYEFCCTFIYKQTAASCESWNFPAWLISFVKLNFFPFWGGQLTNDKKSGMSPNHVKQFRGPRYLAATSVEVYKKINSCAAILRTTLHRFCRCKLFEVSQAYHFALKGQLMLVLLKLFVLHFWLIKCGEIAVLFFYYSTNIKVTTLCFNSNYVEGKKLMDFSFWCTSVSYSQRPGLFNLALYF